MAIRLRWTTGSPGASFAAWLLSTAAAWSQLSSISVSARRTQRCAWAGSNAMARAAAIGARQISRSLARAAAWLDSALAR